MTDRSPDLDKEPAFTMEKVEDPLAFGGAEKDLSTFRHRGYGLNRPLEMEQGDQQLDLPLTPQDRGYKPRQ